MMPGMQIGPPTRATLAALLSAVAVSLALQPAPRSVAQAASAAASPAADGEASARRTMSRAYQNLYGHDFVQTLKISARFAGGRELTRTLQITRKQSTLPGKALARFLEPEDIRKTSMLLIDQDNRHADMFLFLPAFQMVRRVSSAQRADSFFGTDVSYEDLEPKSIDDFEFKSLGSGEVAGVACERIEARSRDLDSMYGYTVSCVQPDPPLALRTDFYRGGKIAKSLEVDVTSIKQIGAAAIPFRVRIHRPRRGTETLLLTQSYEARADIPDQLFSGPNLEFGDAARDLRLSAGGGE